MATNENVLIDAFIKEAQDARATPQPDDIAFETFAAQTVLRHRNLSDEEIETGRIGGGKDGGIDALYVFQDGILLDDDSDVFADDFAPKNVRKNVGLELWLIQAKRETSFSETAFDKAQSSLTRLLDLNQTDVQLSVFYSLELIERMRLFTRAWTVLGSRSPEMSVRFDYATKGDLASVNPAVMQKRADLGTLFETQVPGATATVRLIGARELWSLASATPDYDVQLKFEDYVSKGDSYSGLVKLSDYFEFLSDHDGKLKGHLFDQNVRDFQGDVSVNRDIQATLESDSGDDFWWLNNGVTILCSSINIGGGKTFTLEGVQIVNGMQTSHSIHSAISRIGIGAEQKRDRSVLVRVFRSQDEATRDRIIRATNSQTKVPDASLHATEDIHRQIETYFLSNGWFYDRRKNFYKNSGKPSDRIVSISALGQAVMAIGLGRPNDARARPSTLLNNSADYRAIFTNKVPLDTYLWLATTQRRIDSLLSETAAPYVRSNIRFHVSTYLVTKLFGQRIFNPVQLAGLAGDPHQISILDVEDAVGELETLALEFEDEFDWPFDRVAKSKNFAEATINKALHIDDGDLGDEIGDDYEPRLEIDR